MKKIAQIVREYAVVIVTMLVAGMITGACTISDPPHPIPEPMMRVRDCRDSQPIRLMPNHLQSWDPPHIERWT